jgi:lipoyl-dependent peroxiredoxin
MNRYGSAVWQGGLKTGGGTISVESGALKAVPFSLSSRFEGKPGTNPEELLGAAHAGCFSMTMALLLGEANLTAERMDTKADVTIEQVGEGFTITTVHLDYKAKIPGINQAKFDELVNMAKNGCPVSRVLNAKISLTATLVT